ncbi:MAG: HNH endonuclease [Acutalibacteraceae bacterium]|nr:HNH endonuclease [Acutalibacteraceae bacterium]
MSENFKAAMQDGEVYVQIPEAPMYYVSNYGNVYSEKRNKILDPEITHHRYERVGLRVDGETHRYYVHRLVAGAFCPRDDRQQWTHHINGDHFDNRAANLVWVTRTQHNTMHYTEKAAKETEDYERKN